MYLNKVYIIGNLTRDPEIKALPSGIKVATFGLATNRPYKDKDGKFQNATDYHNIVVFGRQAETSAQYLKKGQTAMAEGRIQTRSWEQNGEKKYRTEIVAERIQFGPKAGGATSGGNNYQKDNNDTNAPTDSFPEDSGAQIDYPEDEINPEDIPF
jgi:single-strand DNA-binding protein